MEETQNQNYISLLDAAKLCSYSEPYLRLRARQGKLKSIKLGKKWVTTAAWIDDYERRVQEWRAAAEVKKEGVAAMFVEAPAQIARVLEPMIDSPAEQEELGSPVSPLSVVFCDYKEPLLPPVPKRLKTMAFAGQIYPLPKQELAPDLQNYGWFGALVSGAVCALILFLAANPGGISRLMDLGSGESGQASISRPIFPAAKPPRAVLIQPLAADTFKPVIIGSASESGQNDLLKEMVDSIASFLKGF